MTSPDLRHQVLCPVSRAMTQGMSAFPFIYRLYSLFLKALRAGQ